MKNLLKVIAIASLCTSTMVGAAISSNDKEKEYRFKGDVEYASFCKAVLNDDVSMLKSSIRSQLRYFASSEKQALRILLSKNGVKCDGENLVEFSIQRDAANVYAFFQK